MGNDLQEINQRLSRIEQALGIAAEGTTPMLRSVANRQPLPPPPPPMRSALPTSPGVAVAEQRVAVASAQEAMLPAESWGDLESRIGKLWLPIIGSFILLVGGALFLKWAFDNNLISPAGRVFIGILSGLGFIAAGELLVAKYKQYAHILTAAGIGILYLSVYSAYNFYDLIGTSSAMLFMSVVTALGALLAVHHSSLALAILTAIGGYMTPLLINSGSNDYAALFAYIGVLNAGILLVAVFRKWRQLPLLGLVGTIMLFLTSGDGYTPNLAIIYTLVLTIYYIEFLLVSLLNTLLSKEKSDILEYYLIILNAAWYFGMTYAILKPEYEYILGTFTALLALIYGILAYAMHVTKKDDKVPAIFFGGTGLVFLTLVFPIQFEQQWITIAWLTEATVLIWMAVRTHMVRFAHVGIGVFSIALFRLVAFDTVVSDFASYTLLFNERVLVYVVAIIAAFFAGYLFTRPELREDGPSRGANQFFYGLAGTLLFVIMNLELSAYYTKALNALGTNRYVSERRSILQSQRNVAYSVLWSLYASAMLIWGLAKRMSYLRAAGLALFAITVCKVFFVDLAGVRQGIRFFSFIILGLLLIGAGYLYYRRGDALQDKKQD